MIRNKFLIFTGVQLFFFWLFLTPWLNAQFVPTNGPNGGNFNHFAQVGGQIWLGTDAGLYVSDDGGLTWVIHPDFHRASDIKYRVEQLLS